MTHSDFRRQLQAALQIDAPQGDAKQRTLEAVTAQMQAAAPRPRLGFAAFLRTQVRFIGWKIWLFQALCLLIANGALDTVFGDYYFFNSRPAALCLGALAMLVLLTALPVVYNASLYHMQEMEAASYFSSQRLLAAKLLIIGMGDGVMLVGLWSYALLRTPLSAPMLPLYLLLPFLLAAGGCLTLMGRCQPQQVCLGGAGWCGLVFLALSMTSSRLTLLTQAQSAWIGVLGCTVLCLYCFWALRYLLRSSAFAELQLN